LKVGIDLQFLGDLSLRPLQVVQFDVFEHLTVRFVPATILSDHSLANLHLVMLQFFLRQRDLAFVSWLDLREEQSQVFSASIIQGFDLDLSIAYIIDIRVLLLL
jgi:hypothetical protein